MRKRVNIDKKNDMITYAIGIAGVVLLITLVILFYNITKSGSSTVEGAKSAQFSAKEENNTNNNTILEQASSKIGEKLNETKNAVIDETENIAINTNTVTDKVKQNTASNSTKQEESKESKEEVKKEEVKKELVFSKPVEGEIIKEFAKDTLIYSNTLNEWTTHLGVDIKAEKTTVVKAAEDGTVKYIKNDPRYGLTIVIEHIDGYSTIYANLLTTEFVEEGEKVEKGQTIGTVGNTAVFEIADESHLHFEILKDNVQLDPGSYLK